MRLLQQVDLHQRCWKSFPWPVEMRAVFPSCDKHQRGLHLYFGYSSLLQATGNHEHCRLPMYTPDSIILHGPKQEMRSVNAPEQVKSVPDVDDPKSKTLLLITPPSRRSGTASCSSLVTKVRAGRTLHPQPLPSLGLGFRALLTMKPLALQEARVLTGLTQLRKHGCMGVSGGGNRNIGLALGI